jgi:hypothetical protein
MTLAATKIQIETAMMDSDNYMVRQDAIANHMQLWQNCGVKTFDGKDANNVPIDGAIIPIQKNQQFLVESFNLWKGVLADMLGPVVQSSSEAVTREEVIARNEVRDAITNSYLSKIADSVSEVYRVIQELATQNNQPVTIQGGFLEQAKRQKQIQELQGIYQLAKDSGLNTQGFAYEFLLLSDLEEDIKNRVMQTFNVDPNASPFVVELKNTIQQAKDVLAQKDQQIAILRTQASQRLERQSEYVAMTERVARMKISFEQWKQETKDAQQARLELMKNALAEGRMDVALQALDAMERRDGLLLAQQSVDSIVNAGDAEYSSLSNDMNIATQPTNMNFNAQPNGAMTPAGWG